MHTPLSVILKRLRVLSDLEVEETQYTRNLIVGPGQEWEALSDDALTATFEPSPCGAALEAFLTALPQPYLGAIACLMYGGRDGRSPEDVWAADVQAWTSEQMIDSICEKYVRMKYIDTAVEALGGSELVNALPSKLTSGS